MPQKYRVFIMLIENVNIEPLLKAFKKFEAFRQNTATEQEKAGVIQAFEYCFELVWKTMKKLLEQRGLSTNSPRETFRVAALEGFIRDPEMWFVFLLMRNLTSHTYNEHESDKVLAVVGDFSNEVHYFLCRIGVPDGNT
jgi:nucleotidyltransferase substrate binding protein (TIGR01987 family)